ncbi:hypothetical protein V8B97DRAFT_2001640 [Scleroderma yunnanense]
MPTRPFPKAYILLLKTHRLTIFLPTPQSSTIASLKSEALSAFSSPVLHEQTDSGPVLDRIPTAPGEDEEMFDGDDVDGYGDGGGSGNEDIPNVQSTDNFELCRAIKDRGKSNAVTAYEVLDPTAPIRGLLGNWEELYVQFRDEDGNLLPVQVSQPSLLDEEEEDATRSRVPPPDGPVGKGKRKAPPE